MSEEVTPSEGGGTYAPPATQADLDRIVGERLARDRQKYADYDDLKAKASKFDEVETASKTEMQKLQDAITERDAKLADLPTQVRKQAIHFASLAATKGFLDPEDALLNLGDAELADDEALNAALDELATRKPHLVKTQPAKRLPTRPKPDGTLADTPGGTGAMEGKERAVAALREFRSTR